MNENEKRCVNEINGMNVWCVHGQSLVTQGHWEHDVTGPTCNAWLAQNTMNVL
jgi:hypothetical protein